MDAPTSSYATAGIALRVSGALKPHHHDKAEKPSVGIIIQTCDNLNKRAEIYLTTRKTIKEYMTRNLQ
jgi:hypothetical protein